MNQQKHSTTRKKGRLRSGPTGQSMVEFALILPILVMIMSGIMDFARVYYVYVALEDSTSEGATFLAMMPGCITIADESKAECGTNNSAEYRIEHANTGILNWDKATIVELSVSDADGDGLGEYGDLIIVRVSYDFSLLTPLINSIAAINPMVISVETIQVVAPLE